MTDPKRTLFFALAVALQVLLLAGIPAQRLWVLATGRTIRMEIKPVDPYNVLSGYYARLGYDISRPASFPKAPPLAVGDTVYAVLEEGPGGIWVPVELLGTRPAGLAPGRVFLRGEVRGRWSPTEIRYGIEAFFVPESQREEVEHGLRTGGEGAGADVAEIRVDERGNAAIVSIRVDGRDFE